jgi:RimJ/RimL family protein N-acetyltransferase
VPVSLRTPRLVLRPWRDHDIAAFIEMSADPVVMEYLPPADEAWVARARAHWDEHGFGQWVVEMPGRAPFIGVVGLGTITFEAPFTPAVDVAWRLARPYWGRGYAAEAAKAALDYAFEQLGLGEIVALTVPANQRSRPGHGAPRDEPLAARRFRSPAPAGRPVAAARALPVAQSQGRLPGQQPMT